MRARNADVAAMLEEKAVFPATSEEPLAYGGGGDGSMVLDHEIVFVRVLLYDRCRRLTLSIAGQRGHELSNRPTT